MKQPVSQCLWFTFKWFSIGTKFERERETHTQTHTSYWFLWRDLIDKFTLDAFLSCDDTVEWEGCVCVCMRESEIYFKEFTHCDSGE